MKTILFFCAGVFLLILAILLGGKSFNRMKYKIRMKNGIQKSGYMRIGGIDQYYQIRGENIENPIILVIHGGPGNNMSDFSYCWQTDLEKEYTIVHWDQRGCGNTYYRDTQAERPSLELLLADLDEVVNYLRVDYYKEKLIIMGHSWGTFLGAIYAGKHPEKVSAYISVSQVLDFNQSERISAQEAVRLAKIAGKEQDIPKINNLLEQITTYQKIGKAEVKSLLEFRQLKEKYLPKQYGNKMILYRLFSPYMNLNEIRWMFSINKMLESNNKIYEMLMIDGRLSMYDYPLHYDIPVIMIIGNQDWTTPYSMALDYYQAISAPQKEFITIEGAGHLPFIDHSKEFSKVLEKALNKID